MLPVVLLVNNVGGGPAHMTPKLIRVLRNLSRGRFRLVVTDSSDRVLRWTQSPRLCAIVLGGGPLVLSRETPVCAWKRNAIAFTRSRVPIFGVCFGIQVMAVLMGGSVRGQDVFRERRIECRNTAGPKSVLFRDVSGPHMCSMMQQDYVSKVPAGLRVTAKSGSFVQAMEGFVDGRYYGGVQFHPEDSGTFGEQVISNFVSFALEVKASRTPT